MDNQNPKTQEQPQSGPHPDLVADLQSETTENTSQGKRKCSLIKSEMDWQMEGFDYKETLKNLSKLANQELVISEKKDNSKLYVADYSIKSLKINKLFLFVLKGESEQTGSIEITRKYEDFHALREALARRWPGCFIPPIPEKGNIGNNEKQVTKNKINLISNFLNHMVEIDPIFTGEEFQVFLKSNENEVEKLLSGMKAHPLEQQYTLYKNSWPEEFKEINQLTLCSMQDRIKKFEDNFGDIKQDLVRQKDSIKRLAQLKSKLDSCRIGVFENALPQYENICLNWFTGKTNLDESNEKQENKGNNQKMEKEEVESEDKKDHKEDHEQEIKTDENDATKMEEEDESQIFSHRTYKTKLEEYKNQMFEKQGQNDNWLIYQMFKYQLREIQAMMQAITTYRYSSHQKRYYQRNIQANKQQLQDISNNKLSIKIFLLSGSEEQKKAQLTNQLQTLEQKFKISEQLWNAQTQHVINELEKFQKYRAQFYRNSIKFAFKMEAMHMVELINFYSRVIGRL